MCTLQRDSDIVYRAGWDLPCAFFSPLLWKLAFTALLPFLPHPSPSSLFWYLILCHFQKAKQFKNYYSDQTTCKGSGQHKLCRPYIFDKACIALLGNGLASAGLYAVLRILSPPRDWNFTPNQADLPCLASCNPQDFISYFKSAIFL